jgi:hypothetical protein
MSQPSALRIPIYFEGMSGKAVSAETVNVMLNKTNGQSLQEVLEITFKDDAVKKVNDFDLQINKAAQALNRRLALIDESIPNSNIVVPYMTCYVGDPNEVVPLIQSLSGVIYSDQMTVWGFKYREQTIIISPTGKAEVDKRLSEGSLAWRTWKSVNGDILLLTAVNGSHTDINESIIPSCE